jgi:hypothetical protein
LLHQAPIPQTDNPIYSPTSTPRSKTSKIASKPANSVSLPSSILIFLLCILPPESRKSVFLLVGESRLLLRSNRINIVDDRNISDLFIYDLARLGEGVHLTEMQPYGVSILYISVARVASSNNNPRIATGTPLSPSGVPFFMSAIRRDWGMPDRQKKISP